MTIKDGHILMSTTRLVYRESTPQIDAWIHYDNTSDDPRIIKGNYNFDPLLWVADYLEFRQS